MWYSAVHPVLRYPSTEPVEQQEEVQRSTDSCPSERGQHGILSVVPTGWNSGKRYTGLQSADTGREGSIVSSP